MIRNDSDEATRPPAVPGNDAPAAATPEVAFGPLAEMIGYQLRRAQVAVFQDFHETLAGHAVRPAEFSVLLLLRENPGIRQSRLADALGIKRANFVPLFDRLEARGWAVRQPVAEDRRALALTLTLRGREKLEELLPLVEGHATRLAQRLGRSGQQQLLALLGRLTEPQ